MRIVKTKCLLLVDQNRLLIQKQRYLAQYDSLKYLQASLVLLAVAGGPRALPEEVKYLQRLLALSERAERTKKNAL